MYDMMWIGYETGGDIKDNAEAEMRLKISLPRIWRTRSGNQIRTTNLAGMIWMRLNTHFVCCRKCKNCIQHVAVPGLEKIGIRKSSLHDGEGIVQIDLDHPAIITA
jgi:hypothetical protein